MSGLLASLFQPNKGHLSPAGRAFVSWLEIVILGIVVSIATIGLDYTNGHPGDYSGLLHVMVAALVISLLKAFAGLSIPRLTPQTPQPASQQPVPSTPPQSGSVISPLPQFAPIPTNAGMAIPPAALALPPGWAATNAQSSYTALPQISMPMAAMPQNTTASAVDPGQIYNLATQSVQAVPGSGQSE
jgi:hypothetical protein